MSGFRASVKKPTEFIFFPSVENFCRARKEIQKIKDMLVHGIKFIKSPALVYFYMASAAAVFAQGWASLTEKAVAPHSSTLAWKIPWTEEPGRVQSLGSLKVRHDWATSLSLFTFVHWRRKWQPTPVFLPGESQGQRSLVGCRLWGCTEWDTTEAT